MFGVAGALRVKPRGGFVSCWFVYPGCGRRGDRTLGFGVERLRRFYRSIPHVSFVDFEAVFFAQPPVFILE